jgi:PAS domain S-box-containing protein
VTGPGRTPERTPAAAPDPAMVPTGDATERLRLLVDAQTDYAIFLLDPEGRIASWNPGAALLKGYAREEIVGRSFEAFYPPEQRDAGRPGAILEAARRNGRHEEEGWRVRRDGSRFWASVVITALHDAEGRMVGFGKVTRDLTNRREAEEALRTAADELRLANDQLEQFRLLVTSVRDYAIFMLDPEGRIQTWNTGAEQLKGYTADDVIGRHFELFYDEEARGRRHPDHELEVAAAEGRFEEEGWRIRQDGSRFWANVVITALRGADGALVGYAKVTRDLTERRQAEQRLLASERAARAEAERQRRRTRTLEMVGRSIAATVEIEEIVQSATDAAAELTGAVYGAFLFRRAEEDPGGPPSGCSWSGSPDSLARLPMPQDLDVFTPTPERPVVVRSPDITRDPRANDLALRAPGESAPTVRSYLAVPVITAGAAVAGLLVFGHHEPDAFGEEAEETVVSIAATAGVALSNARLLESSRREIEAREVALQQRDRVARALQESLLPPALPTIPGVALGALYHPGTELVGGDFYDVFPVDGGGWGVVLGDVCGSGPEAASQTALSRHSVRMAALFDSAPPSVLHALNEALLRSGTERFTTAAFARLVPDPSSGAVDVVLASAGHPAALVVRADGATEETHAGGPLLGLLEFAEDALRPAAFRLEAGDTFVLFTDGLVEARRHGDLFGTARVATLARESSHLAPTELARTLVDAALEHADAPVHDDIAVVVLRAGDAG